MPERLEQVATDFHKGRTWPPRDSRISEWYFRVRKIIAAALIFLLIFSVVYLLYRCWGG